MTILGGIHHFLGPTWGAVIFIILSDQLSSLTEHWWLFFGAILIAFILLSPEGISGIWIRLRGRRNWTLTAEHIPPPPNQLKGLLSQESGPAAPGEDIVLNVDGLSKKFGSLVVADKVDLKVKARTLHSLIGPNGAGKTTFFNMLTGLLAHEGGRLTFRGHDITAMPAHRRIDAGLARSFQIVSVFTNLTVFETARRTAARCGAMPTGCRRFASGPGRCLRPSALPIAPMSSAPIWPMASNACSKSRWHWRPSRSCCCWTSRWLAWAMPIANGSQP